MSGFNRVILMGNLTRDPELKYLPSNIAVCEFGMAMNRRWKDKDGNQRDEVCFVDISAFGRTGEMINQYMNKGKPILIEGRLKFDSWTGQDGQKRSKLSVVADSFAFVGSREGGGGAPMDSEGPPQQRYAPRAAPPRQSAPPPREPMPAPMSDDAPPPSGDEIPF
ncbi:MAG: single-stranded DNA-binding protein [Phycisphaerae bacterium]